MGKFLTSLTAANSEEFVIVMFGMQTIKAMIGFLLLFNNSTILYCHIIKKNPPYILTSQAPDMKSLN
jgi:hypothetical protein